MSNQSKILLGVAGAALTGVVIGLLVAPCSGEETRNKVRKNVNAAAQDLLNALQNSGSLTEQVGQMVDTAKAKFNEAKGYMNSKSGTIVDQVEEVADTVKAKYNEAKGYVKAEANTFKNQVEAAV